MSDYHWSDWCSYPDWDDWGPDVWVPEPEWTEEDERLLQLHMHNMTMPVGWFRDGIIPNNA